MGKIAAALAGTVVLVLLITAAGADALMLVLTGGSRPSPTAHSDIPADYLALYLQAALTCPGLDWSVLAAIGKVESDHGRSKLPGVHSGANYAGAQGPMQFEPATFSSVITRHPLPVGGDDPPSPYNPHDAIYAAAAYLCDSGARGGRDLTAAIYAYNHADWYVSDVLAQAQAYRGQGLGSEASAGPAAL